ncbi:MAG: dihydrodipicolinate synthase family protein [Dysosmobacter sp.]|nr:dihydrodipicolinate synthase family protein [Dysosmobacter sp.]
MKELKRGIMPACMTIWNADETLNKKGMERYLRWVIDKGANNISVCGSTGENIAMTIPEQKEVIEFCVKTIAGEVPVIAGTGHYSTKQTIDVTKFAADCGADAALVILPFYLAPHNRAAMNHYREIHKHTDLPLICYNNPNFAGYELSAIEIAGLYHEGAIAGVKAAQGDVNRIHDAKDTAEEGLWVLYGNDYDPMEAFFAGADGWLSGLPGIFPKFCMDLFQVCAVEKNVDAGRALWKQIKPFIDYFYTYYTRDPHWQEIFKYVLKCQGLEDAGLPRLPLGDLSAEEKRKIDKILQEIAPIL